MYYKFNENYINKLNFYDIYFIENFNKYNVKFAEEYFWKKH